MAGTMPISLVMFQRYDDALFIKIAASLAQGHWFGPYDQLTLVKAPGYSIYLALGSFLGLPLNILEPATFLLSALMFASVLSRFFKDRNLSFFLILIFILICPGIYITRGRVIREFFYASLTISLIAAWIYVFIVNYNRRVIWSATGTGFLLVAFWFTREESIAIVPSLSILSLYPLVMSTRSGSARFGGGALQNLSVILLVAILSAGFLKAVNYVHYGTTDVVEMTGGNFQRAMTALQRVGAPYKASYLPVPRAARESIYKVSPSFAKLREDLEKSPNPTLCKMLPTTCGDIAGGWFMWYFRDAAAKAGFHQSARIANDFYRGVAREVEAACDDGRLKCVAWLPPLVPAITAEQWHLAPGRIARSLSLLIYSQPFEFAFESSWLQNDKEVAMTTLNNPEVVDEGGKIQTTKARLAILKVWCSIVKAAAKAMSVLTSVGVIVFVPLYFAMTRYSFRNPMLYILSALIIGVLVRVSLLILVDISSFPTIFYPRFNGAHVLASAFTALSILSLYQGLHDHFTGALSKCRARGRDYAANIDREIK